MKTFWNNLLVVLFVVAVVSAVIGFVFAVAGLMTLLDMFLPIGLAVVVFILIIAFGIAGLMTWEDNRRKRA